MNKKTLSTIGMVVSLALVVCGILSLTGVLGGDSYYGGSAPYDYESGYATFGADFYTYVTNNAGEAASAARATANNVGEVATLLKNIFGFFFIGFGALASAISG